MNVALIVLLTSAAQIGPTLPFGCSPQLLSLNAKVQSCLAGSDFEGASKALAEWPHGEIGYTLGPGLPAYAEGVDIEAAKAWSDVSNGALRFRQGKNPLVSIVFVPNVAGNDPLPEWRDGVVVATIGLTYGANHVPMRRRSLLNAIGKAFGFAFGLAPNQRRSGMMGIDTRADELKTGSMPFFDTLDKATIQGVLSAYGALADLIAAKVSVTVAKPRLSTDRESSDIGAVTQGTRARFKFTLTNEGNAPLELNMEKSCGCIILEGPRRISPAESMILEPEIITDDLVGIIDKKITLYTNDLDRSVRELTVRVVSMPELRVLPDGFKNVLLNDEGPTEFDLTVFAMPGKRLKIIEVRSPRPEVVSDVVPWSGDLADPLFDKTVRRREGYRVRLRFLPEFQPGLEWLRFSILTDSKTQPKVDVSVRVHKGIVAEPKTLYFGNLSVGRRAVRTVTVEHPTEPFEIAEAYATGFAVSYEKDGTSGRKYKLTVEVVPAQAGLLRSQVVVRTNSKRYPELIVPVSGDAK